MGYEAGSKQRQTVPGTRLDPRSRPSDLGPQILRILTQILRSRPSDPEIETPDPEIETPDPEIQTLDPEIQTLDPVIHVTIQSVRRTTASEHITMLTLTLLL